jgi:AcrR family transcriptional regulator
MSKRDPKQLILDAALAVFGELGFERATTAHIIARAGISNGALFHHFASKDAIAEALYLRGIASYQAGLVAALAQHRGSKAARAAVKAAVHHHLAWVEANRELAWFMYERGRPDWQPAHGSAVRRLNRATARHVHDWMTPLVQAQVLRHLPLTVLSAFVNGPAHFIARRWLSGLITARPTSFADALAEAAWAAVAPHRPRSPATPPQMSSAARLEAAASQAAQAAVSMQQPGDWSVIHLTMNAAAAPLAIADRVRVNAIRTEGEGRVVMIDLDLVDAEGNAATRASAICAWRSTEENP